MSTVMQKLHAARAKVRLTLRESLETAGITIPDQVLVRRMMEATRLRLWATASERRIRCAWYRRATRPAWRQFAWRYYTTACYPPQPLLTLKSMWGGEIPVEITSRVGRIQKLLPEAKITVYASLTDPWIEVSREGDEPLIMGGWINGKVII